MANKSTKYKPIEILEIKLHTHEIELILKSLELFNFNLNNCWVSNVNNEKMKNRSDVIFYLYHSLLEVYTRDYEVDYRIKTSKRYNSDIA